MLLIPLKWSDNFQCSTFPSMPLQMPVWMRKLFMFVKGNWKRPRRIWPKLKAKFRSCRLCSEDWLVSPDSINFNTSLNIESQSFQVLILFNFKSVPNFYVLLCVDFRSAVCVSEILLQSPRGDQSTSKFILGCSTRLFLVYRFKHIPIHTHFIFSNYLAPLCVTLPKALIR